MSSDAVTGRVEVLDDAEAVARYAADFLLDRALASDGRVDPAVERRAPKVVVPGLADGRYRVTGWDTAEGRVVEQFTAEAACGALRFIPAPIGADRAFAVKRGF